jgi:manganese transport protein
VFRLQIALADPDLGAVIRGFAPTVEIIRNPDMLYLALGILGATVMPHNLYLHSAIVQTRAYGESLPEKREALKFATIDSTVALMFALLINASILILAAATFHAGGNTEVANSARRMRCSPADGRRRGTDAVCASRCCAAG